ACDTHAGWPYPSVAHCHGTTAKFCTQPRNWCEYVWLSQRNLALLASRLVVSGSPAPASTLPSPLNARSSFSFCWSCQATSFVTSSGVIRIVVLYGYAAGSRATLQLSPTVQLASLCQRSSGRKTSSTCTLNQFRQCPRWTPLVSHWTRP